MIPFNFSLATQKKAQKHEVPFDLMYWKDDIPRHLWSEDGYIMVATMPKLTDKLSTVRQPASSPFKADAKICRTLSPSLS